MTRASHWDFGCCLLLASFSLAEGGGGLCLLPRNQQLA
jgi:hypothetical protein